jgi:hypothetical protein
MKSIKKSGKNTLKKKNTGAKYVVGKQRTYTIKAAEHTTPWRSALSWLYAANVTAECMTTQSGQGKTDI